MERCSQGSAGGALDGVIAVWAYCLMALRAYPAYPFARRPDRVYRHPAKVVFSLYLIRHGSRFRSDFVSVARIVMFERRVFVELIHQRHAGRDILTQESHLHSCYPGISPAHAMSYRERRDHALTALHTRQDGVVPVRNNAVDGRRQTFGQQLFLAQFGISVDRDPDNAHHL